MIRRADGAMDARVDGALVLLSPADFSYHGVDAVGARVWELLAEPRTEDQLVEVLVGEFDVEPAQCRADLEPFLAHMARIGVLELGPSRG